MRKLFPLHAPGKADARVVDAVKADIRRYVKRERRKVVPQKDLQWEIDCAVGRDEASAAKVDLADVGRAIDAVAAESADSVFVSVIVKSA